MTGSIGTLLVLGASGDLAGRLLLPAVGQLMSGPQGPASLTLVGAGAEQWDQATWRARVAACFATVQVTGPRLDEIVAGSTYLTTDVTRPEDLQRLLDACAGVPAIYFRVTTGGDREGLRRTRAGRVAGGHGVGVGETVRC